MGWTEGDGGLPRWVPPWDRPTAPPRDGAWIHVAADGDGRVYVNGTRVAGGRPTGSAELEAAARDALDILDQLAFHGPRGLPKYSRVLAVKNALRAALQGPSAP